MNKPIMIASLALFVIACNITQKTFEPPLPPNSSESTETSSSAPSPPAPTPVPSDLVWFAPNMGSHDYPELFTKPDQWSQARSRINVIKFYTQNVIDAPCIICGTNTLNAFTKVQAFQKLNDWGTAIAIEVGAVKHYGCTGFEEFRGANAAIQNVQANGGTVSILDMDEPYIGGEAVVNGQTCGFTMEQSATVTSRFIQKVNTTYPNILVGDTEPYPYFSVSELEQWILALQARGVALAHFHLDVDMVWVRADRFDVTTDLQTLSQFLQEHKIPFGVIFISDWTAAGSDRAYFDSTMEWVRTVNNAIGRPQHVIFQSWQADPDDRANQRLHKVPINLPENDPSVFSHTRLILEGLEVFNP